MKAMTRLALTLGLLMAPPTALRAAGDLNTSLQFRDWSKGCEEIAGAGQRCFLYQSVMLNNSNEPILKAAIGHLTDDPSASVLILTVPLGVYLPAGLTLDAGKYMRREKYDYLTCDAKGCRAIIDMTAARLKAFRAAPSVKIVFQDGQHRPLEVPLSLRGLSAGLDAL